MHPFRWFARLGVAIFFTQIAQADVMTFLAGPTDFHGLDGTEDGLSFDASSFGSGSNYNGLQNGDADMHILTGPLVSSTATSWTFTGGTLVVGPGTSGTIIPSPPPGYSTCEDAGFLTLANTGSCIFASQLDGTLIGNVTLSLSNIIGYSQGDEFGSDVTGYPIRQYLLTGSVLFDINANLALAAGVTTGPYLGWFAVDGLYWHNPTGDPGFLDEPASPADHGIDITSIEVTGASVPEPSSLAFLSTVVCAMGLAFRRRPRASQGFSSLATGSSAHGRCTS